MSDIKITRLGEEYTADSVDTVREEADICSLCMYHLDKYDEECKLSECVSQGVYFRKVSVKYKLKILCQEL